ncbi:MAG TPA: cysteine desulfurase-like protein [Kofleriaceae bacterium]|nr:cysteine desulfurase-like protein [Kofleriaceae bacterium]
MIDVEAIRARFPSLARRIDGHPVVHLDGPAGSQVPDTVAQAVADALVHHNGNTHGLFATSREAEAIELDARRCAADLFGADDPDCVVFGPNATTLLFAVSRAIGRTLGGDDEVVVTQLDHDANVAPWMVAAREAGAGLKVARVRPEDGELDLDDLAAAVSPRTRVVAVTAASNAIGALTPVARIAELAHAYGALLVVDAVHYAPHRLMDVAAWGCDLAVCSPYKFFGPHAGVLWGRRETLESLPAYRVRPVGDALPYRWMPGTPSFEAMAGTAAAIRYIASLSGVIGAEGREALAAAYRRIAAHEQELCRRLLVGLAALPVTVYGPADPDRVGERAPTVAFTHATRTPAEVAAYLGERGVFVWHGNYYALELSSALGREPDGMVRVGVLHYNTDGEIDRLLSLLGELGA